MRITIVRLSLLVLVFLTPCSVWAQTNWLVARGTKIVDSSTDLPVSLRAVGLGGWLLQEGYMLNPQGCSGCPGTQWQMKRQYLNEGKTLGEVEDFYRQWRDHFITEDDIAFISSLGFNSVRLPMHYELFLTSEQRNVRNGVITNLGVGHDQYKASLRSWLDNGTLFVDPNADGFAIIDRLIHWCAAHKMYLILDLHAAPGAQGTDLNICDGFYANNLWEFPVFQDVTNQLWLQISNRYKSEPQIAMYEFVNEPNNVPGGGPEIHALTQRLISTVRGNGDNHLIGIHGNGWGNVYDFLEPFTFSPNWGLVYSAHRYGLDPSIDWQPNGNPNVINRMIDMINFRSTHNVPVWVGETGENSNDWLRQNIAKLEQAGIGWCHWTYKRHDWRENPALFRIAGNYPTDGAAVMPTVLNQIRFENLVANSNTIAAVTAHIPTTNSIGCSAAGCVPLARTIWIQGNNGDFVSSENGQSGMTCNTASVGSWERFDIVEAGDANVALRGSNGLFVSSENGQSPMTCNRPRIDAWEKFAWIDFGDGTFGLKCSNGKFVSSENGAGEMMCNRDTASAWERFTFDAIPVTRTVATTSIAVTRGDQVSGDLTVLSKDDQVDFSIRRRDSDIQAVTEFIVTCESPVTVPRQITISLDGSVFARTAVVQNVRLFDFDSGQWILIDSRPASRLVDRTDTISIDEQIESFIDPASNQVRASIRFESVFARQKFSSNTDHVQWTFQF